ncbi:MAG: response regulator transcription factor [Clostridium sp.]
MEGKVIYLADDELKIQELIKMFLIKEGFTVKSFFTGEELLESFKTIPSDMVILDVMMEGKDGLEICKDIRSLSNVPIIIVSAKDSELDRISGLVYGCDDYLTKPFSPMELVLRVKAIFKRATLKQTFENKYLKTGDIEIDMEGRVIFHKSKDLKFTQMEYNLFLYLAQKQNVGVSRDELLNRVWGFESEVDTRATDDMIKRIRKKLLACNSTVKIVTIWGFGFKLMGGNNEKDNL